MVELENARCRGRLAGLQWKLLRLAATSKHSWLITILLGKLFPVRNEVTLEFHSGGRLSVPLGDRYWVEVALGKSYEPEVGYALDAALRYRSDALFLDCGANLGYWSVRYAHIVRTVAVEPNPDLFARLSKHANENGFVAVQAAVWSQNNDSLSLSWLPSRHAAASVVLNWGPKASRQLVSTVTLDSLAKRYGDPDQPIAAKLDVEGSEIQAIRGSSDEILDRLFLVYEDHGRDRRHKTTQHLLDNGFDVFWPKAQCFQKVEKLAELSNLKQSSQKGYNLVAIRPTSPWRGLLD